MYTSEGIQLQQEFLSSDLTCSDGFLWLDQLWKNLDLVAPIMNWLLTPST